ncbi:hypothetical protein HSX11_29445 [Oxalobacteraceae bacterium]|nr:hypothetical protein [Oxalobacteraceae bacterium]
MPVDIFVDNALLTGREARSYAVYYKLLIQKAKSNLNKINDLQSHNLYGEKMSKKFLPT